jgi:hypothetical protein
MKKIATIILLLVNYFIFSQEKLNCSIIKYGNKGIIIKAPKGWILDCESGSESGINAVFYKNGETWQNAKTVMYLKFASLKMENQSNLNDLILYDTKTFKENYEGIEIKTKEKIELEKFGGIIKYFGGGNYESFEYLAYLDLNEFAIMTTISSRTKSDLNENYPVFKELLKSIKVLKIEYQNE